MFVRPTLIPEGQEGAGDGKRHKVRDPLTLQHLADEGEHKPSSDYWLRRLNEGGIEIVNPPPADDEDSDEDGTLPEGEPAEGAVPIADENQETAS